MPASDANAACRESSCTRNPTGDGARWSATSTRSPTPAGPCGTRKSVPTPTDDAPPLDSAGVEARDSGFPPAGKLPMDSDEREKPAWLRKPYLPRQYVAAALNSVSGSTRISRVSTCSTTPDTGEIDPS